MLILTQIFVLFNHLTQQLLPAEDVQIGPSSFQLQYQLFHQIFGKNADGKQ